MNGTKLQAKFKDYQFISITNQNSEPINTQLIGKDTSAFLADVNIQFVKNLVGPYEILAKKYWKKQNIITKFCI